MELPLFPLGQPLFPGGGLALNIFEPRYLSMISRCIATGAPFGVVLIKAGFEVGTPAKPCGLGCSARIQQWGQPSPDRYQVQVRGETRFILNHYHAEPDGLLIGEVAWREPADPTPVPTRYAPLSMLLRQAHAHLGEASGLSAARFEDAAWVAYRLAERLPITPERRQALLEIDAPLTALQQVHDQLITLNLMDEDPS